MINSDQSANRFGCADDQALEGERQSMKLWPQQGATQRVQILNR